MLWAQCPAQQLSSLRITRACRLQQLRKPATADQRAHNSASCGHLSACSGFRVFHLPTASGCRSSASLFIVVVRACSASPADYLGCYHAFLVQNLNTPAGSVYVSFGDWSGGKVTPGNSQPAILSVGTLSPGASKMVYFYLQSPDSVDSTVDTTFVVKVWRFRPSSHANSGFTSAFNFTLSVKDSLAAAGEI